MFNKHSLLVTVLAPLPFCASIPLAAISLETAPDLPYTWEYKGCYIDRVGNRALKRAATSDVEMTGGLCSRWCLEQGFNVAGTEWGRECYCGFELNKPVLTRDADCSMPCSGWPGEACGGSQRITVYETLSGNPPTTNPGTPGFPSLGCYTDSTAQRALPVKAGYEGGLDVAKCTAACAAQGYRLAGVEYGSECYCGNALEHGSRLVAGDGSASGCDYTCSGAPAEFCGGSNRMNLYGAFASVVPTSLATPVPSSTPAASSTPAVSSAPVVPVTSAPASTPSPTSAPAAPDAGSSFPALPIPTSEALASASAAAPAAVISGSPVIA